MVRYTENGFVVEDLGSSNGTFFEGSRTREFSVGDGEVFLCGNFECALELEEAERIQDVTVEEVAPSPALSDATRVELESSFGPETLAGYISSRTVEKPSAPACM